MTNLRQPRQCIKNQRHHFANKGPYPQSYGFSSSRVNAGVQRGFKLYVSRELPDVHSGFRKGSEIRDQIANIHWIIEKAREF